MFRSPSAGTLIPASSTQTRFIQDRIQNVEKHFAEMCTSMAAYVRKIAGQRDKGDHLAQIFQNFAASENVNKSCSKSVTDFSDCLAFVSDYRDAQVHRVEETIISEMSAYSNICKLVMDDVKACHIAQEKETSHHKYVNKLRQQNPLGRMQISKAESDLQQATARSVRLAKSVEEKIDKMEKKKLEDLVGWMKKFILIEMSFHSSALTIFTQAFQRLNEYEISDDLEEFRNTLRLHMPLTTETNSSPVRAQSVPSIALPMTPNESSSSSKLKRSKSFSDYHQRAESLDSLKVEEYEELRGVDGSEDDEDESDDSEDLPRPRSNIRRK